MPSKVGGVSAALYHIPEVNGVDGGWVDVGGVDGRFGSDRSEFF